MATQPAQTRPGAVETHAFLRKGSRFMVFDNLSRVLEPLLVLACAKLYMGGEWGGFKYCESLVLLLTRLCTLGLDSAVIWIHARCPDDETFLAKFSRTFNLVALLSILLLALAALQGAGWLPRIDRLAAAMPGLRPGELLLYLAAIPLLALTQLLTQAYVNKRELAYGLWIRNFIVPSAIYGTALALAFTPLKGRALALCYLGGSLLGVAFAWWGFHRLYRPRRPHWSFSPLIPREMLRFALPISTTGLFMSLAVRMDILLLARYAGTDGIEIYSVVQMVSNTLRGLRQSMDNVMLSVFSGGGEAGAPLGEAQKRHFNYATWLVVTLQIPFFFLAVVFGRELLGLLGPLYARGHAVLVAAMAFNLLVTLGAFSLQMLMGIGKTMLVPVSQGVFFVFSIALNFALIPRFGAFGAAVAMGTANVLGVLVCFFGARYFARSWFLMPAYLLALGVECACFLPSLALGMGASSGLAARGLAFSAGLILFSLYALRNWKRWGAVQA